VKKLVLISHLLVLPTLQLATGAQAVTILEAQFDAQSLIKHPMARRWIFFLLLCQSINSIFVLEANKDYVHCIKYN
jgi:hypothetical protein